MKFCQRPDQDTQINAESEDSASTAQFDRRFRLKQSSPVLGNVIAAGGEHLAGLRRCVIHLGEERNVSGLKHLQCSSGVFIGTPHIQS